jgi:glycosyltransferase involved in cell wall biosynthesis
MRLVFLIPEMLDRSPRKPLLSLVRNTRFANLRDTRLGRKLLVHPGLYAKFANGGTLNIMRHAALARSLGAEAVLATPSGVDTFGPLSVVDLPYIRWSDRTSDDVCVVPDICTDLIDDVRGRVIAYLQVPTFVRSNFDYLHPRVRLWTDSPFMLEICQRVYPEKQIPIVPNIVDSKTFAFRPQSEREPGLLMAFPRKGPEFIEATRAAYAAMGGTYWRFDLVHGLTLNQLAEHMRRPQAFLASAEVEGCALPPQECMAAGIVVVGKSARGANFSMEHKKTALIAETPEEAARGLREIEDAELRAHVAKNGHKFISRYFPENEPTTFWLDLLKQLGFAARPPAGAKAVVSAV